MPYLRIWVSDAERAKLLSLARAEEAEYADLEQRPPERVRIGAVARACFLEGMAELARRVSEYEREKRGEPVPDK